MNIKRALSALATLAFCTGATAPASAQAWLGTMAGEIAGNQGALQLEFNCRHATPVDADRAKGGQARVEKTMTAFLALTSSATPKDLAAVFEDHGPAVRWQDGDQTATLEQVASHLAPPAQAPRLVTVVMGGDGASARTIWSGQDANGPVFYAVDFTTGTWLRDARIIDMAVTHGAAAPETPPAYCHLSGTFVGL